eukprot:1443956-Rhodomonas_salina.1
MHRTAEAGAREARDSRLLAAFHEMAKARSDCNSGDKGGSLGVVAPGKIVSASVSVAVSARVRSDCLRLACVRAKCACQVCLSAAAYGAHGADLCGMHTVYCTGSRGVQAEAVPAGSLRHPSRPVSSTLSLPPLSPSLPPFLRPTNPHSLYHAPPFLRPPTHPPTLLTLPHSLCPTCPECSRCSDECIGCACPCEDCPWLCCPTQASTSFSAPSKRGLVEITGAKASHFRVKLVNSS